MNWQAAIEHNRQALLRIIAAFCAVAGIKPDPEITLLPPEIRKMILRMLLPAESAARRLIVIAAKLYEKDRPFKPAAPIDKTALPDFAKFNKTGRIPAFKLFDTRKKFNLRTPKKPKYSSKFMPRISVPAFFDPVFASEFPAIKTTKEPGSKHLLNRLKTLQNALNNVPKQARRLARLQQRRMMQNKQCPKRPLRPGLPPGHRKKPDHPVYAVLKECHALALDIIEGPT